MPQYLIRQSGNDTNGGTSKEIRSQGVDGVTAGTNTLTSVSANWTQDDVGHGMFIGGVNQWRTITAVTDLNTLTFSGATIAIGVGRTWVVGGAWRTINNALGNTANSITNGDVIYIGAGIYREIVTVNITSPTAEVQIIGDINGVKTDDAGEIQWSSYLINDETAPTVTALLNLSGKDFLTIKNISFICTNNTTGTILANTATSTDIKITNCVFTFVSGGVSVGILYTVGFGVLSNWIIDGCIFTGTGTTANRAAISITLATGSGVDYDANIIIKNCCFFGISGVNVTSSGSSAQEGGGVTILNCSSFFGSANAPSFGTQTTRVGGSNFQFPIMVLNCFGYGNNSFATAGELGAIIENYNIINHAGTARVNVNIGANSVADGSVSPLLEFGQSFLYGFKPRPLGIPLRNSTLLCHGDGTIGPEKDIMGIIRPKGATHLLFQGTSTTATSTSLTDTSKNFGSSGNLKGYTMKILDGVGKGQTKTIYNNSPTTISGDGLWQITPDSTSKYAIFQGPTSLTSVVSTGSVTTLQDNYANWGPNFWQGYTMFITSGAASGQNFIVSGNSPTVLTGYYPLLNAPSTGNTYELFWGAMLKGTVSTGTAYTITDNTAQWPIGTNTTGFWLNNWRIMVTEGFGAGSNFAISGNSPTVLSGWNSLSVIPQSGDKYVVFQNTGILSGYYPSGYYPPYGRDYIHTTVGAYAVNDTAIKETGIVLSGANSIKLFGPGIQDFKVPVSGATTLNVWGYFDSYYFGVKPQLIIFGGSGIGIADNTGTMLGASGQWEQLSLSFTGTNNGVLIARLQSNCTGVGGSAFFDSFSIT